MIAQGSQAFRAAIALSVLEVVIRTHIGADQVMDDGMGLDILSLTGRTRDKGSGGLHQRSHPSSKIWISASAMRLATFV